MKISNFFYDIKDDKPKNKRIVVLSDIHYYSRKNIKKLNKVLSKTETFKPDFICMPGDIFDEKYIYDEGLFCDWLEKLGNICPVIMSIGNHELYDNVYNDHRINKDVYDKVRKVKNVYVLDNELVKIDGINFIGLSYTYEYYDVFNEHNKDYLIKYINNKIDFNPKGYTVLLSHSPIELIKEEVFNNLKCSRYVDLVVSGHTHGGITPNILKKVMRGYGFFSPTHGHRLVCKKSYGKYKIDKTNFVISSGIMKLSHRNKFRCLNFLFSPEITIIDI